MKTMTCTQLGGACSLQFRANSFDTMAELSKSHGMSMKGDPAHQEAMTAMMKLMKQPAAMQKWFEEKKKLFESLPADR